VTPGIKQKMPSDEVTMSLAADHIAFPTSIPASPDRLKAVRHWLWAVIGLVFLMVLVGGTTRLTGSGLSITEWRPVTGAIPPLSDAAWALEFEKYRQISQYQLVNKGMSLADFQFIYWWEWGHRQLGRFIGAVYLAGFIWTVATRRVGWRTGLVLFGMGLLLALQATIGWIMVASGLKDGMTAVAPVKLTLHLTFACLFLASLVAMVTWLTPLRRTEVTSASTRTGAAVLLVLVFLQIALGGLVAGSKAGWSFNTWPLMDGGLAPSIATLFAATPWLENFVDNIALVQFNHRLAAYVLLAFAIWHALSLGRKASGSSAARRARALAGLVTAQAILGIVTLLLVVPLWAGLAHQGLAMVVLAMATVHVTRLQAARA
jgi:heme a synthase